MSKIKIVSFCGRKQSGKNSACNFIVGYRLCQYGKLLEKEKIQSSFPTSFSIDDKGKLIIETNVINENGVYSLQPAEINLNRKDEEFIKIYENCIWPICRIYSFADSLKEICIRLFGLKLEQCFGTDEDKNSLTNIRWNDMMNFLYYNEKRDLKYKKDTFMTAREVLQYFGTNVCRKLYSDCWVNDCLNHIIHNGYEFNLISDVRFLNEIKSIQSIGGKVILLKRQPFDDSHLSETELGSIEDKEFDAVIDNRLMSIQEQNKEILKILHEWDYLTEDFNIYRRHDVYKQP